MSGGGEEEVADRDGGEGGEEEEGGDGEGLRLLVGHLWVRRGFEGDDGLEGLTRGVSR